MFKHLTLTTLILFYSLQGFAQKGPGPDKPKLGDPRSVADFDIRTSRVVQIPVEADQSLQSSPGIRARISRQPNGRAKSISAAGGRLAAAGTGTKEQLVRGFLQRESRAFGFLPKDPDHLRLLSSDETSDISNLFFQQYVSGIPVLDGSLKASFDRSGALLRVDTGNLLSDISVGNKPKLTGRQAIEAAYRGSATTPPGLISDQPAVRDGRAFYQVEDGPNVPTELMVFPLDADTGSPVYRVFLQIDADRYYEILVDATDGSLLSRHNLVRRAGQARIWKESPLAGPRELVTFPEGWIPAESQVLAGNNTDVFIDRNGDGRPDTTVVTDLQGGRAFSLSQVFDFLAPEVPGVNPGATSYRAASVTNLFYLVNTAHDFFYGLGFTEAAGNFQTDNFGRGGIANDAVIVFAQSGLSSNNASFATLPDGLPSAMRVGIFTNGTILDQLDDHDAAYDGTIILHEYSHGVNSRLVGGPSNVTCLRGVQSGAMDEGWADYFSASFYNTTILASYSIQRPAGLRRQNYSNYSFTYEDLGNEDYQRHNDGEIWAATLLDVRRNLGASITNALVLNGLKLTPCSPTMIAARDAILAADQATNNGVNQAALWRAFARHGLGFSAQGTDGNYDSGYPHQIYYVAAFDLPPGQQTGNKPPVISSSAPLVARAGALYSYKIEALDSDGGTLRYELLAGPSGLTLSPTGLLQGLPDFTAKRVKVAVTDGQGGRTVVGFLLNVETPLAIGQSLQLSGAEDSVGIVTLDVPANTFILQVKLRGGSGDADFFLTDPDGESDLFGVRTGISETISISQPKAGRWTIDVYGYEEYGGKTLTAEVPVPGFLANAVPILIGGEESSETYWKIPVPTGATRLEVRTTGGTGDVDLFLKRAVPPACQTNEITYSFSYCIKDFHSATEGNEETILVENPEPGDWYLDVSAAIDYTVISLTATVSSPPGISLNASDLSFTARQGTVAPPAQNLVITNFDLAAPPFAWTAAAATTTGGDWLRLSATSGNQGATLAVSVMPNGLAVGTYLGQVTIASTGLVNSPQTVNVTFTITAAGTPVVLEAEAINGASFLSGVAPGSWFTIRGTNLSQTTRIWTGADFQGAALPTSLDGVRVKVNGKDAYVYFISGSQINALAPDDITTGPVQVTVTNRQGSGTATAKLAKFAPAFFSFDPQNRRYAAAVHLDRVLAGPTTLFGTAVTTRPLAVGNRILLYGTGFGPTTSTASSGVILDAAAALLTTNNLSITIGGVAATVEFAGLVSNGLYQFNVIVPQLANGDHALVANVGGVSTPTGVFVNVSTPVQ